MATTGTSAQNAGKAATEQSTAGTRDASANNLPAPVAEDLVGGILDPDLPRTVIETPNYPGKAIDDRIGLAWDAPNTGLYLDGQTVSSGNLNSPIDFRVTADKIKPNEGTTVRVWYTVSRNDNIVGTSLEIDVPIGEQVPVPGDVEPPAIEGVVGGVLNLVDVPAEGATAVVPPYASMSVGDIVFADINSAAWEENVPIRDPGQVGQPVIFKIPKADLQKFSGTTITVGTMVFKPGEENLVSLRESIRVLEPVGELPVVEVPEATGNSLIPGDIEGNYVEVVIPNYSGIAQGDKISFRWENASGSPPAFTDEMTVGENPQDDHIFEVPRIHADQNLDSSAMLSYTITRGSTQSPSAEFQLFFGEAFEAPLEVDLALYRFIVGEKPPVTVPPYASVRREAKFGAAPYTYSSGDPSLAVVDNTGNVTFIGSGVVQISATDSRNETRSFQLTIKNLKKIFFVSPSANFAGAALACAQAGLNVPTLDDMKAFWVTYFPSSGPVAVYMGWLSYQFWTGTTIGADTAYAYDLNGMDEQNNATGRNVADFLQVVGVTP